MKNLEVKLPNFEEYRISSSGIHVNTGLVPNKYYLFYRQNNYLLYDDVSKRYTMKQSIEECFDVFKNKSTNVISYSSLGLNHYKNSFELLVEFTCAKEQLIYEDFLEIFPEVLI